MNKFFFFFFMHWILLDATVFVIGDSHVEEFIGIPDTKIVHVGSITMFRVIRDHLSTLQLFEMGCDTYALDSMNPLYRLGSPLNFDEIRLVRNGKIPVQNGDVIVYALGQIDVGWHIYKQMQTQKRTSEEIIEDLVRGFIGAITPVPHVKIVIYSITPPVEMPYNPPYEGSLGFRIQVSKSLNTRLRQACIEHGFEFLDVYDDYADGTGRLRPELSRGVHHIHFQYNAPIRRKLMEIIETQGVKNK